MADYGSFDNLPVWDRKIADWLMPYSDFFDLMLILIAGFSLWAIWGLRKRPELKALYIAFVISP
jgi:hypothetical protein